MARPLSTLYILYIGMRHRRFIVIHHLKDIQSMQLIMGIFKGRGTVQPPNEILPNL